MSSTLVLIFTVSLGFISLGVLVAALLVMIEFRRAGRIPALMTLCCAIAISSQIALVASGVTLTQIGLFQLLRLFAGGLAGWLNLELLDYVRREYRQQ